MSEKQLKQLEQYEARLERYKKDFAKNGVTDAELRILDSISKKIEQPRKKLLDQGVIPTITVTTKMTLYNDKVFVKAFDKSVVKWSADAQRALNAVSTYFQSESSGGLSLNDVLSVIKLALTKYPQAALVIETVSVMATVVDGIYKSGLPKQPSLSQIHDQWFTTFDSYARKGKYDKEYGAFVKDYKRREKIPANVDKAIHEEFLELCENAWKQFPTQDHMKKAFLTKILKNVPDSWDTDGYAGVAEIEMLELANSFSGPNGQLDDVNEKLMNAIKTVWKNERVVNLPVPIIIEIENVNGGTTATIKRKSNVAGNTSFKLTSGRKEIFEAFMNKGAYNLPKVSDLTCDD